jgi:peptidoglycan hydrolase-like protein with peptidoglycan-binding domain
MRRLMLTTVSVLALGLGGAGLAYAAGNISGNPGTGGALPPSASGTSQSGTAGGSTMPSGAGTSQSGYTSGAGPQSAMPSMSGNSQWGTSGRMSRHDEVTEAQQKLQADNLYHGKIDGRLGPETKQALRDFQKQNGLRVTANLDRDTMNSLLGTGSMGQGSTVPPKTNTPMTPSTTPTPSHPGGSSTIK